LLDPFTLYTCFFVLLKLVSYLANHYV